MAKPTQVTNRNKFGQWYWHEPIYRNNFALLCCPADQAADRLRLVLPEDVCAECDPILKTLDGQGRFICTRHDTSGLFVVIWLKPSADVPTMAHEALHATWYLLKDKGLRLSEDSEEAYTYMLEWLLREIMTRRNSLKSEGATR